MNKLMNDETNVNHKRLILIMLRIEEMYNIQIGKLT